MIRVVFSLTIAAFALAPAAYADDFPTHKPGLWEMTMNPGRAPPQVMRYCLDAATDAEMRRTGEAQTAKACGHHDVHRSGNTVTSDAVCHIGSSEVRTHAVTTFTDDTAYSTVTSSHYEPPINPGLSDTTMRLEAKWLGACGADMQPGDMIVQGRKMHMPTAPH